jgi:hypothetical protein
MNAKSVVKTTRSHLLAHKKLSALPSMVLL